MKKQKLLILSLCAVLLVAVSVWGTLAYLTSQATVVNTFTVGKVEIRLDETAVTPDGVPIDGADRTKEGNRYHLIPGQTYVKDPTVTVVKGSEESYVRMLVTVNRYKELTAIFGDPFLPQYFVAGWDDDTWVSTRIISEDEANNTATYEFRYKETVKPTTTEDLVLDALFDSLTVPDHLTGAQLATIQDFQITVQGHAIQKSGFDDAADAWAAFDAQMNG